MRNVIVCVFALMLLILTVNANEKLDLKKDESSNNEELQHDAKSLIKSESENSAKPELGTLQKSMLLKDAAKSQTQETPMKHMKLLPESKNVSQHDSPHHKVMSANDKTYNKVVSSSLMPLHNDPDNTINSATVHTTASAKNPINHQVSDAQPKKTIFGGNNKNIPLTVPHSLKINSKISGTHVENSTNNIEEITIVPFDVDITDIVTSMLLGTTENGITDVYPEDILGVVIIGDEGIDGLDVITDQPEPETTTGLFTNPLINDPLLEAITLLEHIDLEITTIPDNSSWPIENFEFFVFDDNVKIPCILMIMNLTLSVSYETKDQEFNTTEYELPNEIVGTGHCGNQNSSMTLSWDKNVIITKKNSITFNFAKDNSSFYVDSVHIDIVLDPHNFPNAKDAFISGNSSTNLKLFSAPVQNGIHVCSTETQITCGPIIANIHSIAVIAYNKNPDLSGRKEEYCHITPKSIIEEVNVGGILGGIIGVVITLAIAATLCSWYRRRPDITLRSELP